MHKIPLFNEYSVYQYAECPDNMLTCSEGRVDDHQPPCISTDQRCDGVIDCIGGEDELDHNCPCGPEGAVRLVDGIVPHRGRVEFCENTRWSTFCYSYYSWRFNAPVVCRQLGYPSAGNGCIFCTNRELIELTELYMTSHSTLWF